jgi:hypothetical protein
MGTVNCFQKTGYARGQRVRTSLTKASSSAPSGSRTELQRLSSCVDLGNACGVVFSSSEVRRATELSLTLLDGARGLYPSAASTARVAMASASSRDTWRAGSASWPVCCGERRTLCAGWELEAMAVAIRPTRGNRHSSVDPDPSPSRPSPRLLPSHAHPRWLHSEYARRAHPAGA